MKRQYWFYLFFGLCSLLAASCGNNPKPMEVAAVAPAQPVMTEPFRFHKLIEVSPGQDYDVLSWGRGSKTTGSFIILHSDSAAKKYTTTTGDLDGDVVDVYNSDMDMDGNPEIIIQAKGTDTLNYTNIYAFEFTYGKAQKLDFPKLSKSQKQGYRGNDNFYIKDGQLYREFPIFSGSGKDTTRTTQKRLLQYGLHNNSFTVKQLSKDSTNVKTSKPVLNGSVKAVATEAKQASVKKTKRHTVEKKHKKRRRRRHVSDDEE